MITESQKEAISDEFQSTFAHPHPNVLQNLFYPYDIERVEAIIRKHAPEVVTVHFRREKGAGDEYSMWSIYCF